MTDVEHANAVGTLAQARRPRQTSTFRATGSSSGSSVGIDNVLTQTHSSVDGHSVVRAREFHTRARP